MLGCSAQLSSGAGVLWYLKNVLFLTRPTGGKIKLHSEKELPKEEAKTPGNTPYSWALNFIMAEARPSVDLSTYHRQLIKDNLLFVSRPLVIFSMRVQAKIALSSTISINDAFVLGDVSFWELLPPTTLGKALGCREDGLISDSLLKKNNESPRGTIHVARGSLVRWVDPFLAKVLSSLLLALARD